MPLRVGRRHRDRRPDRISPLLTARAGRACASARATRRPGEVRQRAERRDAGECASRAERRAGEVRLSGQRATRPQLAPRRAATRPHGRRARRAADADMAVLDARTDPQRPARAARAVVESRRRGRGGPPRNDAPPGEADRMDRARRPCAARRAPGRGGPAAPPAPAAASRRGPAGATPAPRPGPASWSTPSGGAGAASATPTSHSPATAPTATAPSPSAAWRSDRPSRGSAGEITRGASRNRSSISGVSGATSAGIPSAAGAAAPARGSGPTEAPGSSADHQPRSSATRSIAGTVQHSDQPDRPDGSGSRRRADRSFGRNAGPVLEAERQRTVAAARGFARPSRPPLFGEQPRRFAVRACQPRQRPRPRNDTVDRIPAAAGRKPPSAGVSMRQPIDQPGRLAHRRRRQGEVRQRIPDVAVGAVLADDHVRPERRSQRGHDAADRRQPGIRSARRLERDVDAGSGGAPLPELVHESGPGKERSACLVEGDRRALRHRRHGAPGRRLRGARPDRRTARAGRLVGPGQSPGRRRCRCRSRWPALRMAWCSPPPGW